MTEDKPPEPEPSKTTGKVGFWQDWKQETVGCLAFFASLALCLFLTTLVADFATRGVGRTEVSDALYHTGLLLQWCCGGSIVSVVISAIIASQCARRVK